MPDISLDRNLSYAASILLDQISTEQKQFVECYMNLCVSKEKTEISCCTDGECPLLLAEVHLPSLKNYVTDIIETYSSGVTDQTLRGEKEGQKILSRSVLNQMSMETVLLALVLAPSNYMLWNFRRKRIKEKVSNKIDAPICLLKELLFTSLILSCYYKLEDVWNYRKYIITLFVTLHCSENRKNYSLLEYDTHIFLNAAQNHPMNYNAWGYRRNIFACFKNIGSVKLHKEIDTVLKFIVKNNSDRSAISFLQYLLVSMNSMVTLFELQELWKKLLFFTQQEIRRHCELGHECMWELRLHLMLFAIEREKNGYPFFSGWRILDEINFISTYVDIYNNKKKNLEPSCTERGWYENSGNVFWTSYYASRYGEQFLTAFRKPY